MRFSETITLCDDLLIDLPNLEVIKDGVKKWYKTTCVSNGSLCFLNMMSNSDEYIIGIKFLLPETEMGSVLNIEKYYDSLKDAAINQEIIEYQENKGLCLT